jgi:hypothetical protein
LSLAVVIVLTTHATLREASMTENAATDVTTQSHVTKRPYLRPVLKRYGSLAQLTEAKGMGGQRSDGAIAHNNKTR